MKQNERVFLSIPKEALTHLATQNLDTLVVDRLIVSTYLYFNNIEVRNNRFLKEFVISKEDKADTKHFNDFIGILKEFHTTTVFNFENLIELFEFVISPSDRVVNGAVYTPEDIRDYIINISFENEPLRNNSKIVDISCGCGGFLYSTAKQLKKRLNKPYSRIFKENIFGLDIQEYSVRRTKLLLSLLAITDGEDKREFKFNIKNGDALTFDWSEIAPQGFQYVLGNPPYVRYRNLDEETLENLKRWSVAQSGLMDLYIPFFQIGAELLAENGVLSYITMNSFFKSLNGRSLRQYFHDRSLKIIIEDFGSEQVFKSKNTYVCICSIINRTQDFISYRRLSRATLNDDIELQNVRYNDLDITQGWNLDNSKVIDEIENIGIPFGKNYKVPSGVATLRNNVYIFEPYKQDRTYYYFIKEKVEYKVERRICKSIVNSNKLSPDVDIEAHTKKIIYPYYKKPGLTPLEELDFKKKYPFAYEYLEKFKPVLLKRDKGKASEYSHWYMFGRHQSLEKIRFKMFFPKLSNKIPYCILNEDEDLLFYNGLAIVAKSIRELKIAKKILQSNIFWFYIKSTSKPYSASYYSLNSTYVKNFGIPIFTTEEEDFLIECDDMDQVNDFLDLKYGVDYR